MTNEYALHLWPHKLLTLPLALETSPAAQGIQHTFDTVSAALLAKAVLLL